MLTINRTGASKQQTRCFVRYPPLVRELVDDTLKATIHDGGACFEVGRGPALRPISVIVFALASDLAAGD